MVSIMEDPLAAGSSPRSSAGPSPNHVFEAHVLVINAAAGYPPFTARPWHHCDVVDAAPSNSTVLGQPGRDAHGQAGSWRSRITRLRVRALAPQHDQLRARAVPARAWAEISAPVHPEPISNLPSDLTVPGYDANMPGSGGTAAEGEGRPTHGHGDLCHWL